MLMSKAEFLRMLVDIAEKVVSGDSVEGSLQYERGYTSSRADTEKIEVRACYRIDNLNGQGSVRLIEGIMSDDIPF